MDNKREGDITWSRAKEGKPGTRNTGRACLKVALQRKASGYEIKTLCPTTDIWDKQSRTEKGTVHERDGFIDITVTCSIIKTQPELPVK